MKFIKTKINKLHIDDNVTKNYHIYTKSSLMFNDNKLFVFVNPLKAKLNSHCIAEAGH
jgi:hypothetical protein